MSVLVHLLNRRHVVCCFHVKNFLVHLVGVRDDFRCRCRCPVRVIEQGFVPHSHGLHHVLFRLVERFGRLKGRGNSFIKQMYCRRWKLPCPVLPHNVCLGDPRRVSADGAVLVVAVEPRGVPAGLVGVQFGRVEILAAFLLQCADTCLPWKQGTCFGEDFLGDTFNRVVTYDKASDEEKAHQSYEPRQRAEQGDYHTGENQIQRTADWDTGGGRYCGGGDGGGGGEHDSACDKIVDTFPCWGQFPVTQVRTVEAGVFVRASF